MIRLGIGLGLRVLDYSTGPDSACGRVGQLARSGDPVPRELLELALLELAADGLSSAAIAARLRARLV